jgi:hypothetical protein
MIRKSLFLVQFTDGFQNNFKSSGRTNCSAAEGYLCGKWTFVVRGLEPFWQHCVDTPMACKIFSSNTAGDAMMDIMSLLQVADHSKQSPCSASTIRS